MVGEEISTDSLILGIETSCDETACAVVRGGREILSNVVATQIDVHRAYGGVVPEIASRQHLVTIVPVIEEGLAKARLTHRDLAGVATTYGPGLVGSLLVGLNAAKTLAFTWGKPLLGINHLEGHIYANWLDQQPAVREARAPGLPDVPPFPLLCLIVSGGHTELIVMRDHGDYELVGRTRDDAAGEAFDKVARLLGLGFPGGPAIQARAEGASPTTYDLPRAWLRGTHDFSFSGLKTAVLRLRNEHGPFDELQLSQVAASFQWSVVEVLVEKTVATAQELEVEVIALAGGVASNRPLREYMVQRSPLPVYCPPPPLCTDNAAIIACAGYFHLARGQVDDLSLDVRPSLRLAV